MQASQSKREENILIPRKINFPHKFQNQAIKKVKLKINKIFAAANQSYALLDEFIITWGMTILKQETEDESHEIKLSHQQKAQNFTTIDIQVSDLALGVNHVFAYSKSHEIEHEQNESNVPEIYCWGSNKNYELGLQQQEEYGLVKVDIFDEALQAGFMLCQISCGSSHTLALFKDSQTGQTKLFGWGQSKSYQLALDTTSIVPYPVEIQYQFTSSIDKVYSKSDYNIAITNEGQLYSWGSNLFNRLGLNTTKLQKHPKPYGNPIKQKFNHKQLANLLLQSNNLSLSSNYQEEISLTDRRQSIIENTNIQKVKIPRQIEIYNKKIHSLALGTYHVIALTIEGHCFTWGNGIYGQLGNNKFGQSSPQKITTTHLKKNINFVACCAGQHHSCLLDSEGNVFTCGSNSHGVLGHQKHESQTRKKRCKVFEKIDFFESTNIVIASITSGDRHILAMSEDLQVYGWGSNKHGQILSSKDQNKTNQDSKGNKFRSNYVQSPSEKIKQFKVKDFARKNNLGLQAQSQLFEVQKQQISVPYKEQATIKQKVLKIGIPSNFSNFSQEISQIPLTRNRLVQWKDRFNQFRIQKQKQQDQLMEELDHILSNLEPHQTDND